MRAVNLLPHDAAGRRGLRDEDPAALVGAGVTLLVVAGLAAGFLATHANANAERAKLGDAQAELTQLASMEPPAPVVSGKKAKPVLPVPAVTSEEQPRLQAVASTLGSRIAWDRILREFSLVVPNDITIQSLALHAPSPGATGTAQANGLTVSGLAYSHDSVARLLSRLMLIPDLSDVTLGSSTGGTNGVTFSISAAVKGAPAPPAPASAPAATTTGASS